MTNHVLGHNGSSLGVNNHYCIVANDDAGVGIAFGGVSVSVLGKFVEADFFTSKSAAEAKFLVVIEYPLSRGFFNLIGAN